MQKSFWKWPVKISFCCCCFLPSDELLNSDARSKNRYGLLRFPLVFAILLQPVCRRSLYLISQKCYRRSQFINIAEFLYVSWHFGVLRTHRKCQAYQLVENK